MSTRPTSPPPMSPSLRLMMRHIEKQEGYHSIPYKNDLGHWCVGYGHFIHVQEDIDTPISEDHALKLMVIDLVRSAEIAHDICDENGITGTNYFAALILMIQQIGSEGVKGFTSALEYMKEDHIAGVIHEFIHTDWARLTPARTLACIDIIVQGSPIFEAMHKEAVENMKKAGKLPPHLMDVPAENIELKPPPSPKGE